MSKIKWERPSGNPIETEDDIDTVRYLESLGYTQIKAKAKPGPKAKPITTNQKTVSKVLDE